MNKLGFEEAEISQIKLPTVGGSWRKQGSSRKTSTSASLSALKPLTVWITTNCGKFLEDTGSPDHLTCLLRNLCAGQETTGVTGHGTPDWFKIGKGVLTRLYVVTLLFNLSAENIMQNARLDESQAGIKIARRNIKNLRYADDTTVMTESEEELKSFLMRVKEQSEKAGLKLIIKKTKMEKEMATHSSILAWKSPWTEEPGRLQSMGLHD